MDQHRSDGTDLDDRVEGAQQPWTPPTLTRFDASQTASTPDGVGVDGGIFADS